MWKLILAGLVVIGFAGSARAEWYMAHFGADECVPVMDVGDGGLGRAYYHAGPYRTPQDIERMFRLMGGRTQWSKDLPAGAVGFLVKWGDRETLIVMFNDRELCRELMARLEK